MIGMEIGHQSVFYRMEMVVGVRVGNERRKKEFRLENDSSRDVTTKTMNRDRSASDDVARYSDDTVPGDGGGDGATRTHLDEIRIKVSSMTDKLETKDFSQ